MLASLFGHVSKSKSKVVYTMINQWSNRIRKQEKNVWYTPDYSVLIGWQLTKKTHGERWLPQWLALISVSNHSRRLTDLSLWCHDLCFMYSPFSFFLFCFPFCFTSNIIFVSLDMRIYPLRWNFHPAIQTHWVKRKVNLQRGEEGDKSYGLILLGTLPFGCFLEATPPMLLYLRFLVF